ncbi:OCIA domain-containing protein 1 [Bagarius yarrelli]|uniref:OCIA domain-containing protein 1 n=1 Tax=Bagarius yarrelli TaxID=175774 RepID=A0A556U8B7_BAGYA|nr:OCIA domain-containing protein 1 [Bagarius yarrelli]
MSESPSDFTERTAETQPAVLGAQYNPTEEERKVLKECHTESFWYRGKLSASMRFGSLPKVLFAGMCGYFAGKLSYMKTCQKKFYNLENSPIGEALRQRQRHPQQPPQFSAPQSDFSEDEKSRFAVFQSESASVEPYSPPDLSSSTQSAQPHDLPTHVLRDEEQEVKRKPVMYEELRNKNRENYDVTRSQKIDAPKKEVKKNKYGDAWDD